MLRNDRLNNVVMLLAYFYTGGNDDLTCGVIVNKLLFLVCHKVDDLILFRSRLRGYMYTGCVMDVMEMITLMPSVLLPHQS